MNDSLIFTNVHLTMYIDCQQSRKFSYQKAHPDFKIYSKIYLEENLSVHY